MSKAGATSVMFLAFQGFFMQSRMILCFRKNVSSAEKFRSSNHGFVSPRQPYDRKRHPSGIFAHDCTLSSSHVNTPREWSPRNAGNAGPVICTPLIKRSIWPGFIYELIRSTFRNVLSHIVEYQKQ